MFSFCFQPVLPTTPTRCLTARPRSRLDSRRTLCSPLTNHSLVFHRHNPTTLPSQLTTRIMSHRRRPRLDNAPQRSKLSHFQLTARFCSSSELEVCDLNYKTASLCLSHLVLRWPNTGKFSCCCSASVLLKSCQVQMSIPLLSLHGLKWWNVFLF